MNLHDILKPILVPLHKEGYRFFVPFLIISIILLFLFVPLGLLGIVLTAWCYYFFRDPERVTPARHDVLVAPADGIICALVKEEPPSELNLPKESSGYWRISIFMSVFDCHVNRMPVSGKIAEITYTPGRFVNASLDKSSKENERNSLVIDTTWGHPIGLVQIAGLIARRIVCYPRVGDELKKGARYGIIRFGSRVDVYVPDNAYELLVLEGQQAVGGETILGVFTGADSEEVETHPSGETF